MTQTQASAALAPNASTDDRPLVYVNGQMLPKSRAGVNVFDHGLLYGDGVFEGIRVYRGRIFKLGQHLDRLYECASRIRIDLASHVSRDEMTGIMRRCVEENELVEGYIRLVVTRGVGTLGLNPFKCPEPGVICIADQIELYTPEMYENGMRVVVAERPRIPVECLDPRIKSLNYLNNILAKIEAIDAGCLECIMLNTEGRVAEGSGDNIFVVKDGELHTPPVTEGLLEGITRRFVVDELAPMAGIQVNQQSMGLDEVMDADEIFLTGTAAEMIAVTKIGKTEDEARVIGSGREGAITGQLRAKFRQIVTSDSVPED
ncbi:MAG: branched-chain-amino-acid transaminase [Planctomycetota bacterium]